MKKTSVQSHAFFKASEFGVGALSCRPIMVTKDAPALAHSDRNNKFGALRAFQKDTARRGKSFRRFLIRQRLAERRGL